MHPGALASETQLTQERTIAAAQRIGKFFDIDHEFRPVRVRGDLNSVQVSALNQRRDLADFLEAIAEKVDPVVPAPAPELDLTDTPTPARKGRR